MVDHADITGDSVRRKLENLLAYPHENLAIELKPWLDLIKDECKANLAQAILALANHGGGYIILGHQQTGGNWEPATPRPDTLKHYDQDRVNGIVQGYAEPPFHCPVHHIPHPTTQELFPIVTVPGGHRVPIRAKRDGPRDEKGRIQHVNINTYYIRKPGPRSEQITTGQEWDELLERCRANREGESISTGAAPEATSDPVKRWFEKCSERWGIFADKLHDEQRALYRYGVWKFAYGITSTINQKPLAEFPDLLRHVKGHESPWPPWIVEATPTIKAYPFEDTIECWLTSGRQTNPEYADYWRAAPNGFLFMVRGHNGDSALNDAPGTVLYLPAPIWNVASCVLHAGRLAPLMADRPVALSFRAEWSGLVGRELRYPENTWFETLRFAQGGHFCQQDVVKATAVVSSDEIEKNLPDIVTTLVTPLYQAFDFYTPTPQLIGTELAKLHQS